MIRMLLAFLFASSVAAAQPINSGGGGNGGGSYTLPQATSSVLGGIKAGAGTAVAGDGTLTVTGGGSGPTGPAGATGATGPAGPTGPSGSGGTTTFSRSVYTASGAISLSDTLSIINGSSGTLAMTLANGTTDGQTVLIKLLGAANATVTATIDGASGNIVAMTASTSGTLKDSLRLRWSTADTTWIAE